MSSGPRQVAVVGAGPSGLAVALLLARQGRRVVVHERFEAAGPVGAGFILQPTGLAVLSVLGVETQARALGQPLERLIGREARRGRVVLDIGYDHPGEALGVHRAALFDILHRACVQAGVDFETGRAVDGASDGRLAFADGSQSPAFDLVVDASGARSTIAADLPAMRLPLAWGAIWATTPWPGAPFDPTALQQVYRGAARMIGVLPVGRRPGETEPVATFFWSLKHADHAAWRAAGLDAWKAEVLALWPEAAPVLAGFDRPDQLTLARYAHHTLSRPAGDRLAVIGDAAHATSPQLGQGVNMGLLDALALAQAIQRHGDDLAAALDAYCAARRWHVRLYQALSWGFTPFYQADGRFLPWVRDHVLGKLARLPRADRLLHATVAGLLLNPLSGASDADPDNRS